MKCNRCKKDMLEYYQDTDTYYCTNCGNRYDRHDDSGV